MLFAALARRVRVRKMRRSVPPMPGLLPQEEFHRLLARERSRADRNSHPFSMVQFSTSDLPPDRLRKVARILLDHRRLTDDVGVVRDLDLGTVLPDTSAEGARIYAERIHGALQRRGFDVGHRIFTYPGNFGPEALELHPPRPGDSQEAGGDREEAQASPATARAENMETWFLQPLPWWKRAMDVVISSAALLILAPVMATVAVIVKATSPGPVLFRQQRAGRGGRPFTFYKFRTMVVNAEELKEKLRQNSEVEGPVFKMARDPRITPVGRWLRRLSLDELPQLWNVLRGDMSLVGPRPPTLDEVQKYAPWQRQRLWLTGGITGIWQTSGRHEVGFVEWMRMDARYARRRSFWMDVRLLARTVTAVLTTRGAS
ncbi:sugar transferase [Myxococcota bacterium]|nr:sugar transferase [Myxococcota bacterium]